MRYYWKSLFVDWWPSCNTGLQSNFDRGTSHMQSTVLISVVTTCNVGSQKVSIWDYLRVNYNLSTTWKRSTMGMIARIRTMIPVRSLEFTQIWHPPKIYWGSCRHPASIAPSTTSNIDLFGASFLVPFSRDTRKTKSWKNLLGQAESKGKTHDSRICSYVSSLCFCRILDMKVLVKTRISRYI